MTAKQFKAHGFMFVYNNNNNKAFKSQTSWGRLELKPNRSNQDSGTSLGIFHPFKSHFIASTQVNFGLPLSLFTLLSWFRIPLHNNNNKAFNIQHLEISKTKKIATHFENSNVGSRCCLDPILEQLNSVLRTI